MKAKWQKPQFFLLNNQVHSGSSIGSPENHKTISYFTQTQGKNIGAKCMTVTTTVPISTKGTTTSTVSVPIPTAFGCS